MNKVEVCPAPNPMKSSIILPTQQAYNIVKALVLSTKQTVVLCRLDLSIRITVYKTGHMQKNRIIVILFLQALTQLQSTIYLYSTILQKVFITVSKEPFEIKKKIICMQ